MAETITTVNEHPAEPPQQTPHRYTAGFAGAIEVRWQDWWEAQQTYRQPNPDEPGFDASKPKFYALDMFPYPSGAGLHVGHPEGYTATDIVCRYKRLRGFNVLHPMGWDAFGLPAEQYAVQTGVHPAETTKKAIDTFRRQLKRFGFCYDWSREFATIDPEYYRWTQWIWLQAYHAWFDPKQGKARPIAELVERLSKSDAMFEVAGERVRWSRASAAQRQRYLDGFRLAYIGEQTVNWCPKLGTVLANEEVIDGRSERGQYPVLRLPLRQWMFRITAYADRLLDDLALVEWPDSTRVMQAEWIGRSEGAEIRFEVLRSREESGTGHLRMRVTMAAIEAALRDHSGELLRAIEERCRAMSGLEVQVSLAGTMLGSKQIGELLTLHGRARSFGAAVAVVDADEQQRDVLRVSKLEHLLRQESPHEALTVFTTRPDTLFGATYMVVAPEHPLIERVLADPATETDSSGLSAYVSIARNRADVDRMAESKTKTGVFTGLYARNAATGEAIPIWTSDYVLMGYGTGAIMAVPAHDERDFEFAKVFALPITPVVETPGQSWTGECATSGDGVAINSANAEVSLNGLATKDAKAAISKWIETKGLGRRRVNYRLRDWLFSRQRYWGEPFPIVFSTDGRHVAVAEHALPVRLPELVDYQPIESETPLPPLGKATQWVHTTAGAAGVDGSDLLADAPVQRETNTMPGWAGSCWYYLRYCSPRDGSAFVQHAAERYWMGDRGVDLYVGGSEHAVLHLLYARFWHKVLFDLGHVGTPEPFAKLFHQGMITSYAYHRPDKTLVAVDLVQETREGMFVEKATGEPVTQVTAKMSKSLKNVVNPDDIIADYGADTFRLYEMYMGPLEASKPWNTRDIVGSFRFLQRAWRVAVDERSGDLLFAAQADADLERLLHRTIHKVGEAIERLSLNTAIAALIELINAATRPTEMPDHTLGGFTRHQLERFVILFSPFAPHVAEELWHRLGHTTTVTREVWPAHDPALLVEDEVELPVQIQGKVKARICVPTGATSAEIESTVLANADVIRQLGGKQPKKVIIVPGRMVNIVV
ncbi:MAG: leucine--tRNA ligase [Phycisphaerae bacterium]|nr:leucine--tRNA ligase [Phycisphaerae bacterium]